MLTRGEQIFLNELSFLFSAQAWNRPLSRREGSELAQGLYWARKLSFPKTDATNHDLWFSNFHIFLRLE